MPPTPVSGTAGVAASAGDRLDWSALAQRRIFFGHQSVGRDVMGGVRALLAAPDAPALRIVESDSPATVEGPAFMEARIGRNRDPRSKLEAFERIVPSGLGSSGIALVKFCYVDIDHDTDVDVLYDEYQGMVARLEAAVAGLMLVHATIPLRTAPPPLRDLVGRVLGRRGGSAANERRERYNDRLRRSHPPERIFDIAAIEATRPDGSRAERRHGASRVPMLADEWTSDGGHLNDAGARITARALLDVLTRVAVAGSEISTAAGKRDSAANARK